MFGQPFPEFLTRMRQQTSSAEPVAGRGRDSSAAAELKLKNRTPASHEFARCPEAMMSARASSNVSATPVWPVEETFCTASVWEQRWWFHQSTPHDIRHGLTGYSTALAIGGSQPCSENLGTLAGIAGTAAQRDIFSRDYFRVVNDVFPARKTPFASPRAEGDTAVDAIPVPLDNFLFEPIRDVPSVH